MRRSAWKRLFARSARLAAALALPALVASAASAQLLALRPVPDGFDENPDNKKNTKVLRVELDPFSVTELPLLAGAQALSGLDVQPGTGIVLASQGKVSTSGGGFVGGLLFVVDRGTGAATPVFDLKPFGISFAPGLAYHPDGTLYASVQHPGLQHETPWASAMVTIDIANGVVNFQEPYAEGFRIDIEALAVQPTTGVIYGAGGPCVDTDGGCDDAAPSELYTIDKTTRVAKLEGKLVEKGSGAELEDGVPAGLAFDEQGALLVSLGYGDGRILSIDLAAANGTTVAFTELGDATPDGPGSISDIVWVPEPGPLAAIAGALGTLAALSRLRRHSLAGIRRRV